MVSVTREVVVTEDAHRLTYGPARDGQDGEYVLALTTSDEERVEVLFGEQAMYNLWIEVRGVPRPAPNYQSEHDRLVRQVVHYATGADKERLRKALNVLGVPE